MEAYNPYAERRAGDIAVTIKVLKEIEQAVIKDSLEQHPNLDADAKDVLDAQRQRIANAVRIYCAKLLEPLK